MRGTTGCWCTETALTLGLIFHLPLRQTEGFLTSIFGMLGLEEAPRCNILNRLTELGRPASYCIGR